ncbi:hypothetical protein [Mycobacterium sp. C31M]
MTTAAHNVVRYGVRHVDVDDILAWAASAGHAAATEWCGRQAILVSVGGFHPDLTIDIDDTVEIAADLVHTGRTSMHILITLRIAGPDTAPRTTQCPMVFVAIDGAGRPDVVPTWTPVTMLELQRRHQARLRALAHRRHQLGA